MDKDAIERARDVVRRLRLCHDYIRLARMNGPVQIADKGVPEIFEEAADIIEALLGEVEGHDP